MLICMATTPTVPVHFQATTKRGPAVSAARRFEISPRAPEFGGGWRLQLFEGDTEVGGGVFPPVTDYLDESMATEAAHEDALTEAYDWMCSP